MSASQMTLLVLVLCVTRSVPSVLPGLDLTHVTLTSAGPARVDGRRSGEVELTCSASGSPAPSVAWYRDSLFVSHQTELTGEEQRGGESFGETVARLRVSCLTEEDAGQYECRAVAGRQQVSAVTQLNVVDWEAGQLCRQTGRPEISVWRSTVLVEEGSSVVLPCTVSSPGDSIITWSSRGSRLHTGARLTIAESGELRISELRWGDMGQYTCTATNTAGSDQIQSFVYPLRPSLSHGRM